MKKPLNLPTFANEAAEQEFWSTIDLAEHLEDSDLEPVTFTNLKPTSQPISLRLPTYVLQRLKERANSLAVPYQALIKQYIEQGLQNS